LGLKFSLTIQARPSFLIVNLIIVCAYEWGSSLEQ
jgi:hypothetical protein